MQTIRIGTFFCFLLSITAFGQPSEKGSTGAESQNIKTRILRSTLSDSVIERVVLSEGSPDASRNGLPVLTLYKITSPSERATPILQVKRMAVVADAHAAVIKKYYGNYLTDRFEIDPISSIAKDVNLNQCKLIPFRQNALGQVEELLEYDITWDVSRNPMARGAESNFTTKSVLSAGTWYKLAIQKSGVYRIGLSQLNAMGINTTGLDPRNIRIYGNGGAMLPERNDDPRIDDLAENAIKVIGEEDGVFDKSDYILFYGDATTQWKRIKTTKGVKFRPTKSLYSDTSYYFLTVDQGTGKRLTKSANLTGQENVSSSTYDFYAFHEENVWNFGESGRENYGEKFDVNNSYQFFWNDGEFVQNDSLVAEVQLVAASNETNEFNVTGSGLNFKIFTQSVPGGLYADYATAGSNAGVSLLPDPNRVELTVTRVTQKTLGWLDRITINARRHLAVSNKQYNFRDTRVTAPGKICKFNLTVPANSGLVVWNITNPRNPLEQQITELSDHLEFTTPCSTQQEFVVAPPGDILSPVFVGKVANQNLHAVTQAQYLIVTHPLFIAEAHRLGAFHQKQDNLSYVVVTTDEIYNEFSSGKPDISAIRDFIRMVYTRSKGSSQAVKYALLIGDGSYNNMSKNKVNNSNYVPTYQSHNSLSSTQSVATDDFYALMDPDEGYLAEQIGKIDIGIGRFPCRTVMEVRAILAKIEKYYEKDYNFQATMNEPACNGSETTMSDWRTWLVFLGDDKDGAEHMKQADSLTRLMQTIDGDYNYDKIMLDAYQRFSTPGGPRYPDASGDFLKRIKKGALIFNYTGHGGEVGLTEERMIDVDIINALDNFSKLPLFITATCEFSRYDDPTRTSAGELCLLNPSGGAIALLTTCRLAYSNFNFALNVVALEKLFARRPDGKYPTLGEAIQLTKGDPRVTTTYITNFHLLGDPALTLAYPEEKVFTSQINNSAVTSTKVDTLGALAKITISGYVADQNGNKNTKFNGIVYPTVFDKEQEMTTLLNSRESALNWWLISKDPTAIAYPFTFTLQKNILYRGKALVTNGDFSFSFLVPKDISFAIGPGKISYYATNGVTDAAGSYTQLVVGGASKNVVDDKAGPEVRLYFNHKDFVNGGTTNENPILTADIIDSSGVNTLASGLGHDISAILDDQVTKPIVLNEYYESNLNTYQAGRVRYPFSELSEGPHRVTFKVWDIQNNSSVAHADFVVSESAELALKHVLNYPNPFTTKTKFFFEHNQPCNPLKVVIQVYSVSGKLVKTLQKSILCDGFKPEGIDWDGRDDYGDKLARGVYIYRLGIMDVDNKKAEKIEKLVILN